MSDSRLPLLAGGGVALLLFLELIVGSLLNILQDATIDNDGITGNLFDGFGPSLFYNLLTFVAFGIGIWISLRFVEPVRANDRWLRVIRRGLIATLFGTACVFVLAILQALLGALHVTAYPLVEPLNPTVNGDALMTGLQNAVGSIVSPLIWWAPFAVLATLLVRIRLSTRSLDEPEAATHPASDAETLVSH